MSRWTSRSGWRAERRWNPSDEPVKVGVLRLGFASAARRFFARSVKSKFLSFSSISSVMKLLFSIFALTLASAAFAHSAQTYFVSPAGDDSRDGHTAATAWRTVAKVNATGFAPGDVVNFMRGGVWHEPLKPKSGGQPGSSVVFAAYGSGAHPLFVGSDEVVGSNIHIPTTGPLYAVLLDDALRSPKGVSS